MRDFDFKGFRKDFKEALAGVEKQYGVEVSIGKISYSDVDFTPAVKVVKVVEGKSAEQLMFEKVCHLYDLQPEDYGRTFTSNGKEFKLVELKTKSPKYPVIAEAVDGSRYKFQETVLKRLN